MADGRNPTLNVRESNQLPMIALGLALMIFAIWLIFFTAGIGLRGVKPVAVDGVNVVSIPNSPVILENNNLLVHVAGAPTTTVDLEDPLLGVSEKAIKLIRLVEMYQWTQTQESKNEQLDHSVDKETIVYTYKPAWSSDLIDSNTFKDKTKYRNPLTVPVDVLKVKAPEVKVGDFILSTELIDAITVQQDVDLSNMDIAQLQSRSKTKVTHDGKYIFVGDDVTKPTIGDLRISLVKVYPTEISIIAQQSDTNLHPYTLPDGRLISYVTEGRVSAGDMLKAGKLSPWFYYFFSLFLILFGCVVILFSIDARIYSLVQKYIVKLGLYPFAIFVSLAIWSVMLAIAMYLTQPWYCLIFIMIAGFSIFLLHQKRHF